MGGVSRPGLEPASEPSAQTMSPFDPESGSQSACTTLIAGTFNAALGLGLDGGKPTFVVIEDPLLFG